MGSAIFLGAGWADSARGQTDSIGLGNTLQPRCDVDAIAHQVRRSP